VRNTLLDSRCVVVRVWKNVHPLPTGQRLKHCTSTGSSRLQYCTLEFIIKIKNLKTVRRRLKINLKRKKKINTERGAEQ
jgi:hypothetical protein